MQLGIIDNIEASSDSLRDEGYWYTLGSAQTVVCRYTFDPINQC